MSPSSSNVGGNPRGAASAPPFGAMTIETAYQHHGIQARYLNCEVAPDALGDVVRAARAMGWAGF